MADKEIRIALLKEQIEELKEAMEYQYGENFMDNPDVKARIEVLENMIKIIMDKE